MHIRIAPVLATSDGELSGLTEFFEALGRAKHEPCGEHWDVAFGETAWRTAVAAICLSPDLDRRGLISVALSSAFTSIGKRTDQCSEWSEKLAEVREFLLRTLPFEKAAHMYGLFLTHVNCRRKRASSLNVSRLPSTGNYLDSACNLRRHTYLPRRPRSWFTASCSSSKKPC